MHEFEYRAPTTLEEALSLLQEYGDDAKVVAGGTALLIMMKQQLVQPAVLVDLQNLPGMRGIDEADGGLRVGALTRHREVETSSLVQRRLPALAETFARVATVSIRNAATVGGNVAHGDPSLDPPAMLTALDARVRVAGPKGTRELPLEGLYVDYYETNIEPGEIVMEVLVPSLGPRTAATYFKFLPRTEDDYATVGVAARVTLSEDGSVCADARVALSAAGSTTIRARAAEDAVRGRAAEESTFREAGTAARDECDPLSDLRGSSEYKRDMVEVFVRRALIEATRRVREGVGASSPRNSAGSDGGARR